MRKENSRDTIPTNLDNNNRISMNALMNEYRNNLCITSNIWKRKEKPIM